VSGAGGRSLILFDVDHTLVDVQALHNPAYEASILEAHGAAVRMQDITYAGKTTPNILRDLCAHVGVGSEATEACLPDLLRAFIGRVLAGMAEDLRPNVLAGVNELLACLTARGHLLGVVTGNPPEIGREVLLRAGLLDHFQLLTFGTEARERWQLVALAAEKAAALAGAPIGPERTVVIGDTPFDVEAGKRFGARTVLVGTGVYSRTELEAAAADLLLPSFADYGAACERVMALLGVRQV
jgi:phosphoglycolate phosphatase-like HAD superfamily hydrolase